MKTAFALVAAFMALAPLLAFAHPGSHTLNCTSAQGEKSVQFKVTRMNGTGWVEPSLSLVAEGKSIPLESSDMNKSYGSTVHNSPLGVIVVTAQDDSTSAAYYSLSVKAIPSSVKAYDREGNRVYWNLKDEKDAGSCYDLNGKAVFQGLMYGSAVSGADTFSAETLLMDCELTYDSGSAC